MTDEFLKRLRICVDGVLPHLTEGSFALTGGVAMEEALRQAGRPANREIVSDIDFVLSTSDAVSAAVTKRFLVCHFHLPQPGYTRFFIQLVDPESALRVDLFADTLGGLDRAQPIEFVGRTIPALRGEDLFAHKSQILANACEKSPVDTKHLSDAQALAALCGKTLPELDARHVRRIEYSTDLTARCRRCDRTPSDAFRLAPKQAIFDVLGYV